MFFRSTLSKFWTNVQQTLFPQLEEDLGELSKDHKKLASILELVRIEDHIPCTRFNDGRPPKDRIAIARAYIAKIVFKISYTKQLIEYLKRDKQIRAICGWDAFSKLPSEAKFSRAFQEFAKSSLPERVHQALIKGVYKDQIIGHVIKDSAPIEAREKSLKKDNVKNRNKVKKEKKRRKRAGELNRRQKQLKESYVEAMLRGLPTCCDKGMKKSAQGYTTTWKGYKLHAAVDDHCIPLAVIVTSASVNDCEVAIPLATKVKNLGTTNLYDIMDAAYDHPEIKEHSILLGHVPVIDKCPKNRAEKIAKEEEKKRRKILNFKPAEARRYSERFSKERFNALYKDYHGGRGIFYRGYPKVCCQVMFGVLVVTASTLIKLIQ